MGISGAFAGRGFSISAPGFSIPYSGRAPRRFKPAGWPAIESAILVSVRIEDFLTANLLDGLIADLFGSRNASARLGRHVLGDLAQSIADEDASALKATARFAVAQGVSLLLQEIRRVAATNKRDPQLAMQLLQMISSERSVDEITWRSPPRPSRSSTPSVTRARSRPEAEGCSRPERRSCRSVVATGPSSSRG
jgi:hypothetical protein